jgi:predicted AAA+ superfamily ATPase
MWIEREIEHTLVHLGQQRPVVLLTGARQTGKTSLLKKLFPSYGYVSLDLPRLAEEAEESGSLFLEKYPPPTIIDEIQYAPQLFRYLKHTIDLRRQETGLYFLTGSQKFSLMQGVSESLAGRVAVVELSSLSLQELEQASGKRAEGEQLLRWILAGGYPEVQAQSLDPERFFADYLVTYLERDVRQALQVRNLRDFDRFMRLVAGRTGQLLSMNSVASDIGVTPSTVKSWLSVLEASNIILLLEPYYQNLGKRIVKTPKLYFLDTGLACFLAGIHTVEALRQSSLLGALFETLALGQIVRAYANQGRRPVLYFYRDHEGHEVDFVIPVGEKLKLLECKWAETPTLQTKGFSEMEKRLGPDRILGKTILTPIRGRRTIARQDVAIQDCVDLSAVVT